MDDEFEEWCKWFDSHKEPDGSINLNKHPDLAKWLLKRYESASNRFKNIPDNIGDTISFELD